MENKVFGTVFMSRDGVFEAHTIDRQRGKIGGYLLFAGHGESNPYREFDLTEVTVKELRKF